MTQTSEYRLGGVAGSPVLHSLSPLIMRTWLEASGLPGDYVPLAINEAQAAMALSTLPHAGFSGANITLPFKTLAIAIADSASESAQKAGAANLLTFRDGRIHAENTDIAGIVSAIRQSGLNLAGKPALLLGAGGACRAAILALQDIGVSQIYLANRTRIKADVLTGEFPGLIEVVDWDDRSHRDPNIALIVNSTSLGLNGEGDPDMDWSSMPDAAAFDMVYTPLMTPFLNSAKAEGRNIIDGLDMLIGQARPSFEAIFGAPSPVNIDIKSRLVAELESRA